MSEDLRRAFEFVLRADMLGTRVEPFRYGRAVHLPELPRRHDSNYLLVESDPSGLTADAVIEEAHTVQGAAGLAHRLVMFRGAASAERLVPGFEERG